MARAGAEIARMNGKTSLLRTIPPANWRACELSRLRTVAPANCRACELANLRTAGFPCLRTGQLNDAAPASIFVGRAFRQL
jgi:hypothetical protein